MIIGGISDIADRYDAFILDVWGVLHNGVSLFEGTVSCLEAMRDAGKRVILLSNTPSLGADIAVELGRFGISRDLYQGIVTAGDSTRAALAGYAGKRCWFASRGEQFGRLVNGIDITLIDEPEGADIMLNALGGMGGEDDPVYADLDRAAALGLPMICANPDLVVNVGKSLYYCAGTYAAYYEAHGGRVEYHGKPHAPVYERVYEALGAPDKGRICAVGDSFHTDIAGANGFGIDCVFNAEGIHQEELAALGVDGVLAEQEYRPTYVLNGFGW
ncbi:MAG: TIGR01459 family HAD-type hydrolase [Alphaproteobacteria bacterium]